MGREALWSRVAARLLAAAAAVLMASLPAVAAPAPVLEVVSVGFAGRARPGAWTPVWVEVAAAEQDLDAWVVIETRGPAAGRAARFGVPVRAAMGARVRAFIPVVLQDPRSPGTVHLEAGGRRLASRALPAIAPAEDVVVILSTEPLGVEEAVARLGRSGVVYLVPELLPPTWQAYEAVRVVVVRDLDERRVEEAQRRAIQQWVWTGGAILAMPSGDDVRHLRGPTLQPLQAAGGRGAGSVTVWDHDAADPARRADPEVMLAWVQALAALPSQPVRPPDEVVGGGRPVPWRVHAGLAAGVVLYLVAVRRLSRWVALLRPVTVLVAALFIASSAAGAVRLAALVRREASGVVSAAVVHVIPGTGHGVLAVTARVVSPHGGPFAVRAGGRTLVRPTHQAPVTVWLDQETVIQGEGTGMRLEGAAIVPAAVAGALEVRAGAAVVTVTNLSGRRIENPWVLMAGRVQRVPAVDRAARVALDDARWQVHEQLQRTGTDHALLAWAFSHLSAGDILRSNPAWLVGWWRDPALLLRWDGRLEAMPQMLLVPLVVPP